MTRRILLTAALILLLIPLLITAQIETQTTTVDFYGTIESNIGSTLIINGRVVDISGTQMNGMILAPGITVHIVAEIAPNGSLIARQLELVPVGFIPGLVELSGVISEISGANIRIGDQLIDTTNARIIDLLQVGQQVQVFAHATNTTVWEARFVSLMGNVLPPVVTPEVNAEAVVPVILPPVTTPEVLPPVTTPEVFDDDHSGDDNDDDDEDNSGRSGDNSGQGSGDDD
jgi:hypothetical protein